MTRNTRTALAPIALAAALVLAVGVVPAPIHAQTPQEEPEASPEQPPAERRPDEVQPADPPPQDEPDEPEDPMQPPAPPVELEPYGSEGDAGDTEVGTEIDVQPPVVDDSGEQADETTDVLEGDADDAAWYRSPLWVLVGLVALVVVVILLFSGRRR